MAITHVDRHILFDQILSLQLQTKARCVVGWMLDYYDSHIQPMSI